MIKSGTLRNRITIQRYTLGSPQQTATGAPDGSWTTYATVWASIDPVLGREYFAAEQVQSKVDTKIRCRYQSGVCDAVTTAMRVSHGAVVYNIEAPINVGNRNEEWLLMCSTGANQG